MPGWNTAWMNVFPVSEMVKTVKFYAKLMQIWGTEKMGG